MIDLSYAMPLIARVIARFSGHAKVLPGPYTLGRYGLIINLVGLTFLIFTSITFNFPTLSPVDKENMNYTSAAIGVIGLISLVVSSSEKSLGLGLRLMNKDMDHYR